MPSQRSFDINYLPTEMRKAFGLTTVLLFTFGPAIACSPSDAPGFQTRDSAGITIATNGQSGAWGPGDAWQLRVEATGSHSTPESSIGMLSGLAVNSNGNIFVLDRTDATVKVYDSLGLFIRSFGGRGEGPGQLSGSQMALLAGPADSMYVPDFGNRRVSVFAADGHFARSFGLALNGVTPRQWGILPDGTLLLEVIALVQPAETTRGRNAILRLSDDGRRVDTLLSLPLDPVIDMSQGVANTKTVMFEPRTEWAVGPSGSLVEGHTADYRLRVHDTGGALRMIVGREAAPSPVSAGDQAQVRDWYRSALEEQASHSGNRQLAGMVSQLVANLEFPASYPTFGVIVAGPDGTTLVRRSLTLTEMREGRPELTSADMQRKSREWDVFDSTGRWLGPLAFPEGFELVTTSGSSFYGGVMDSLGAPTLVRLTMLR